MKTISQQEMWKTIPMGGIKLLNVETKSRASEAKWIIEMMTNVNFKSNFDIFKSLIGTQKGGICGKDIIFLEKSYFQRQLKTNSKFYKEALLAMTDYEIKKGIQSIDSWDNEHIFYNPLFRTIVGEDEKAIKPTKYLEKNKIFTFGQLLQEKAKEIQKIPHKQQLTNLLDIIQIFAFARKEDSLIKRNGGEEVKFTEITQKILYEEAIFGKSKAHHSEIKWFHKLSTSIDWEDTWKAVHNFLNKNQTKTIIWQQIHLQHYTQYSYNKWHKKVFSLQ